MQNLEQKYKNLFDSIFTRLSVRFTVAETVKKTGYSKGVVSDYLGGKKIPSEEFLKAFAEAYELNYKAEFVDPLAKSDWQPDTEDEKAMTEAEALALIKRLRDQATHDQDWQKTVMEMVKVLLLNPDQVIEWKGKKVPLSSAPAEAVIERASSLAKELLKLQKPE